jgi:predicted deacylase
MVATESNWLRAPASGLFKASCRLGRPFAAGAILGNILDPRGMGKIPVRAEVSGVALGMNRQALVHRGDALIHVADFSGSRPVGKTLQRFEDQLEEQSQGAVDGGDI